MSKKTQNNNYGNGSNNNNIVSSNFSGDFNYSGSSIVNTGVYKGATQTQQASLDMFNFAGPKPMSKGSNNQTVINTQIGVSPMSNLDFGSLGAPVQIGGMNKMKAPIMIVDPVEQQAAKPFSMDEFKPPSVFFIPSKCSNNGGLQFTPMVYNEFTSCVVDESPDDVLNKFNNILSSYSNDIDFTLDRINYIINGTVFIRNFAVVFRISIWNDNNNKTRFEFRRTKGDTVSYQEFWNQMLSKIQNIFTNVDSNSNSNDLPLTLDYNLDLDLDLDDNDDNKMQTPGLTNNDLDNFVDDINECDPSSIYSISLILEALAVQSNFIQLMFNHATFMKCIIGSALLHQDTTIVRGALICLEKLTTTQQNANNIIGLDVLDQLIPLLQHDCHLIRKYSVRVLSKLTNANKWKLNNSKLKKFAEISLKENQQQWNQYKFATNDFIKQQMFKNINSKLISV